MAGKKSRSGMLNAIEGLPGWLVRQGAMWRPLEQKGILIKPARKPRSTVQLFASCERVLVEHLKAVCTWPQSQRNQTWRVGDYSFYVLSFPVSSKVERFVQFWSEPQDTSVLFEVSAGTLPKAPKSKQLSAAQQDVLRDRGFEVGGGSWEFR